MRVTGEAGCGWLRDIAQASLLHVYSGHVGRVAALVGEL
jgi:hypothetical protein